MRVLLVYDTTFGTGRQVAAIIENAMVSSGTVVNVYNVRDAPTKGLDQYDLMIFGTPTHGKNPTMKMKRYVKKAAMAVPGRRMCAYNTRVDPKIGHKPANKLLDLGMSLGLGPWGKCESFCVKGIKGVLKEGEEARIHNWAMGLVAGA